MATRSNIVPGVDAVANIDRVTRSAENTLLHFIQSSDTPMIGSSVEIQGASMPVRLQRWPNIRELRDMRRAFLTDFITWYSTFKFRFTDTIIYIANIT